MKNIYTRTIGFVFLVFVISSATAVVFLDADDEHVIHHAAPVDSNNCHRGPTGYHCHR